jgi:hypothetical protein
MYRSSLLFTDLNGSNPTIAVIAKGRRQFAQRSPQE